MYCTQARCCCMCQRQALILHTCQCYNTHCTHCHSNGTLCCPSHVHCANEALAHSDMGCRHTTFLDAPHAFAYNGQLSSPTIFNSANGFDLALMSPQPLLTGENANVTDVTNEFGSPLMDMNMDMMMQPNNIDDSLSQYTNLMGADVFGPLNFTEFAQAGNMPTYNEAGNEIAYDEAGGEPWIVNWPEGYQAFSPAVVKGPEETVVRNHDVSIMESIEKWDDVVTSRAPENSPDSSTLDGSGSPEDEEASDSSSPVTQSTQSEPYAPSSNESTGADDEMDSDSDMDADCETDSE
ncbi:hypothetical protein GGS21DRAFT_120332 [Xylaria nigripes]|nr:hypothetical protein GGS21DRAFT_120332 [Xylaria nigripes]